MDAARCEHTGEHLPWVLFHLLVAEAQAPVLLVHFQHHHFHLVTDAAEFARVLDALGPAEVADVDETIHTLLQFGEDAEVGESVEGTCFLGTGW